MTNEEERIRLCRYLDFFGMCVCVGECSLVRESHAAFVVVVAAFTTRLVPMFTLISCISCLNVLVNFLYICFFKRLYAASVVCGKNQSTCAASVCLIPLIRCT